MIPTRFWVIGGMILLGAGAKLLPYILHAIGVGDVHDFTMSMWNFSPMYALSLFGGAYLADRRWAYSIPLIAWLLGDIGIAILMRDVRFGFHAMIPAVYGALALTVWLGTLLRKRSSSTAMRCASIAGAGLAGNLTFYLITNFADWALSGRFPLTAAGLLQCYEEGIPFFGRSVAATALFGTLFFGGYELLRKFAWAPADAPRLSPELAADGAPEVREMPTL